MLGLGLKQAGAATRRIGTAWLALVIGLTATLPAQSIDAYKGGALVPIRNVTAPPPGANGLCATYAWACAQGGKSLLMTENSMQVLRSVNARANRTIRPVTDQQQYRIAERWALPTERGGDCEDYALYKKHALIKAGFPPEQLLIAAVLDRKRQSHAVLVVRTGTQDIVLDNLHNRILPWNKTGYTFLRIQDPREPSRWVSVFAGGMLPAS